MCCSVCATVFIKSLVRFEWSLPKEQEQEQAGSDLIWFAFDRWNQLNFKSPPAPFSPPLVEHLSAINLLTSWLLLAGWKLKNQFAIYFALPSFEAKSKAGAGGSRCRKSRSQASKFPKLISSSSGSSSSERGHCQRHVLNESNSHTVEQGREGGQGVEGSRGDCPSVESSV